MPVDTAAASFFTLAALKAYLKVVGTGQDERLVRIADGACQMLERSTKRRFVIRSFTDYLDAPAPCRRLVGGGEFGYGGHELYLREYPVVTLTSIKCYRYVGQVTPDTIDLTYARLV